MKNIEACHLLQDGLLHFYNDRSHMLKTLLHHGAQPEGGVYISKGNKSSVYWQTDVLLICYSTHCKERKTDSN